MYFECTFSVLGRGSVLIYIKMLKKKKVTGCGKCNYSQQHLTHRTATLSQSTQTRYIKHRCFYTCRETRMLEILHSVDDTK